MDGINTDYMIIAVERCFPRFLQRYRTTINLQFDALKQFFIDWHEDDETQRYIVEQIKNVDEEIKAIEEKIELEKQQKKWYLNKMMEVH